MSANFRKWTLSLFFFTFILASELGLTVPNRAYVSISQGVSVIDTTTNTVIEEINLGPDGGGGGFAITPNGQFIYIGDTNLNSVSVIDTATHTVIKTIPDVVSFPDWITISPNGKFAYVLENTNPGSIAIIGTATNTVVASISGFNVPYGSAMTPDGEFLYVANIGDNSILVIDTDTNMIVPSKTIPNVGNSGTSNITINSDGTLAYITERFPGSVTPIDLVTNTATSPFGAGMLSANANRIALTPNGKFIYVTAGTSMGGGVVATFDTANNTFLQSIPIGVGTVPLAIAISSNGNLAYVTNFVDGLVLVIDTTTNTIINSIPVGIFPNFIVLTPPLQIPTHLSGIQQKGATVRYAVTSFNSNGIESDPITITII